MEDKKVSDKMRGFDDEGKSLESREALLQSKAADPLEKACGSSRFRLVGEVDEDEKSLDADKYKQFRSCIEIQEIWKEKEPDREAWPHHELSEELLQRNVADLLEKACGKDHCFIPIEEFDANALVGGDDLCCICGGNFFPGQNVTVYFPCKHPLHEACYAGLSVTKLYIAKCPLDNLPEREVQQFTIGVDVVDQRIQVSPLEELPFEMGCKCCRKEVAKGSYYRFCKACYSPYHSSCAQVAFLLKSCFKESCSADISSMDDFGGLLNVSGGGPGGAVGLSPVDSDSGADGDEAQEEEEEEELFQLDM